MPRISEVLGWLDAPAHECRSRLPAKSPDPITKRSLAGRMDVVILVLDKCNPSNHMAKSPNRRINSGHLHTGAVAQHTFLMALESARNKQ
jgi:hypothetical protein